MLKLFLYLIKSAGYENLKQVQGDKRDFLLGNQHSDKIRSSTLDIIVFNRLKNS